MDDWLTAELPVEAPDLYAIGFQELDLSKEAFLLNNSAHEEIWTPPIESALATKGEYTKLHSRQLVGQSANSFFEALQYIVQSVLLSWFF